MIMINGLLYTDLAYAKHMNRGVLRFEEAKKSGKSEAEAIAYACSYAPEDDKPDPKPKAAS